MLLNVEFVAQAKQIAGMAAAELELPEPATPSALRRALVRAYPGVAALGEDPGRSGGLLLFVDRQQVGWAEEILLEPAQEILITAAMSGG